MSLKDMVKSRKKARTTGEVLIPALDEFLLRQSGQDRRDGMFHPSDLSGDFCPRQWVLYQYHPEGRTVMDGKWSARLMRVLNNGTKLHERLHRYFQEMDVLWGTWRRPVGITDASEDGFLYEYESGWAPKNEDGSVDMRWEYTEISLHHGEDNIKGHTDGATNLAGWKDALEFKSRNSHGFGWLNDTPVDDHKEQGLIYLGALEWMRKEKANGAYGGFIDEFDAKPFRGVLILYECKDTQNLKEYYVRWDPKEYERVMEPKRPLMAAALKWSKGDPLPACNCSSKYGRSPLCRTLTL